MNLEKQVVSLELAKKMKELGFKQESLWWWRKLFNDSYKIQSDHDLIKDIGVYFSAYTVAELGEMLPHTIGDNTWLQWTKAVNGYNEICESLAYVKWEEENSLGQVFLENKHKIYCKPYKDKRFDEFETEADARAKMLIYLKENNII